MGFQSSIFINDADESLAQRAAIEEAIDALGDDNPLSVFLSSYNQAEKEAYPAFPAPRRAQKLGQAITDMRKAFEVIEQDFTYTLMELEE